MSRVIAHIDLDCFYVQVERRINSELRNKPVCVVQYNPFGDLRTLSPHENRFKDSGSLIAVSYEARASGVKRSMRGVEARKLCPELLLVQVPTSFGKADLKIYRDASAAIVSVLGKRYPSIVLERASIDEVYLDLSKEAASLLESLNGAAQLCALADSLEDAQSNRIAGEDSIEIKMSKADIRVGHKGTEGNAAALKGGKDSRAEWFEEFRSRKRSLDDQLLLCGAHIIAQLRQDVLEQLDFTCSGGIAHNKMLAKIASAMHKPNKQTIVPLSIVPQLMSSLPYSRVQGFGGKLGNMLHEVFSERVNTLGDLLTNVRRTELVDTFGEETTQWMLNTAQGIHEDPVKDRELPLSIGCSKSFRSGMMLHKCKLSTGEVLHWLTELCKELSKSFLFNES